MALCSQANCAAKLRRFSLQRGKNIKVFSDCFGAILQLIFLKHVCKRGLLIKTDELILSETEVYSSRLLNII